MIANARLPPFWSRTTLSMWPLSCCVISCLPPLFISDPRPSGLNLWALRCCSLFCFCFSARLCPRSTVARTHWSSAVSLSVVFFFCANCSGLWKPYWSRVEVLRKGWCRKRTDSWVSTTLNKHLNWLIKKTSKTSRVCSKASYALVTKRQKRWWLHVRIL